MQKIKRNLAANIRRLRDSHNMSQQQIASLSGIPRPTWASLETGTANPTLAVLTKAANALNVSIEELIGAPRNEFEFIPSDKVRERRRQDARLRPLVPDALPGLEISRMELAPGGRMVGPLIFNIAGTGAGHNSAKMQVMERAFYQAGFHIVSLPSPTHPNFIATASETQVPGMLADDARDLYRVMQAVYREIAGSIEVSTFYLTGYSLGAAQAAFVAKLDEEVGVFDFEKVLMINPPVSLYNSVKRLDDMIGAIPGGAGNFPAFFESVFERFADVYRQEDFVDFANDFLYKIHKDQPLDTRAFRALVGVSFRVASANIVFTSDVLTRSNVIVRRNRRLSSTDSLTNYYKASLRIGFTGYIEHLLLPFYRHRRPGITLDTLIRESSLEAIAPYLRSSNKIGLIHNADDIILDDSELNFLRTLLGDHRDHR